MKSFILATTFVMAAAGSAFATYDSVKINERIFNDRPDSNLVVTNNYPASIRFQEDGFGPGGFANRHTAYLSEDGGANNADFDYGDAFDISVTVNHLLSTNVAVEAGIHSDLFGLGFFGQLPNGEVVSFGSVLPFFSFGVQPFGSSIDLRIIHDPGDGDGVNPLPGGGTPSYITYGYNLGSGWQYSPQIPMTGLEGGIPSAFPFFIGFGVQHNGATETAAFADTMFTNIRVNKVPAPGAVALVGLAGLVGIRRRR
ncbi:MAG: hypothetical protein JNK58_02520 [Phycisphaerae bacterium]|nr:hypothetical protein [Phycisphaerae bacterium]